ncbi:MAG: hypothetical protein ACYDB7_12610, partial [Mycobacteriales bacterium]
RLTGQPAPAGGGILGLLRQGAHLVWVGLHAFAALLPLWLFLLFPVYLSARRRQLLARGALLLTRG